MASTSSPLDISGVTTTEGFIQYLKGDTDGYPEYAGSFSGVKWKGLLTLDKSDIRRRIERRDRRDLTLDVEDEHDAAASYIFSKIQEIKQQGKCIPFDFPIPSGRWGPGLSSPLASRDMPVGLTLSITHDCTCNPLVSTCYSPTR